MSTVRTVVHPGWFVVSGPQVDAVVATGDRGAESAGALESAATEGLFALLEALTASGLSSTPDLAACAPIPTGLRVVLRGAAVVVLPDGTRLGAQGRMPWLDVDLDLAAEELDEVVLEAPAPQRARGWQRPARLTRVADAARPETEADAEADAPGPDGPDAATGEPPAQPPTELMSPVESESALGAETTERVAAQTLEVPQVEDPQHPVVLAVLCPAGHPSPPDADRCRTCGRDVPPQQPRRLPRPTLGVLRASSGEAVPLDRGVLLGRAPQLDDGPADHERPHVLRVGGPTRDISRSHAEVVLEGWQVLVRDLGSTNGTTVALPGSEPERLPPHEARVIEPGTVVGLAREVELTYELGA